MTATAWLDHRSLIDVMGTDARSFLQGLLTQDVLTLPAEEARWAALLSPQGKVLFDMLVSGLPDGGVRLDVEAARSADLVKRLTLYKLRAQAQILPRQAATVVAGWNGPGPAGSLIDRRHPDLGWRLYADHPASHSPADYALHRLSLGVPEGSADLLVDKMLWLEANGDLLGGVSFTKGCYVGQENTARMHHRAKVRKRLVPFRADSALAPGTLVLAGDREAGEVRSMIGDRGIALLRLDYSDSPLYAMDKAVQLCRLSWQADSLINNVETTG
jgi:tRNA-modifying protein YgfZ